MTTEIQTLILDAAGKRFAHYSYSKTSMHEIAADCDMSVGSLYRFFKNKEAIATATADLCFLKKAEVSEAAAEHHETAFDQLHGYLHARLKYMHQFVSQTPHMYEMVELISTRHKELLESYEQRAVQYLAAIIRQGQADDSLNSGSAEAMAANLYRATLCFNMPLCMYGPLEEKEVQLKSLLKTMFKGLGKC